MLKPNTNNSLILFIIICISISIPFSCLLAVVRNDYQFVILMQNRHEENQVNAKMYINNSNITTNMNQNLTVTIFTFIGIEGSGHHLFQSIFRKMRELTDHSNKSIKIIDKYSHLGSCRQLASKHLNKMIKTTYFYQQESDINHLLFAVTTQLSYPCGGRVYPNMPNLVTLVEDANRKYNVNFNLRFIALKREWIECVVSSCVHRYHGGCKENSKNQFHGKQLIEQQLQIIPKTYWIIIDFHDFTKRKYEYVNIISEWLNIHNTVLVEKSFSVVKSTKGVNNSVHNAWESAHLHDEEYSRINDFNLTEYMMQTFYGSNVSNFLWSKYTSDRLK
eukprot:518650_1